MSSLFRKEVGVTFLGGKGHVFKKRDCYLLLKSWDLLFRNSLGHLIDNMQS